MKKQRRKLNETELGTLFMGKLLTEIMFREIFGESPARLIYRIYGKKWENEGFKFHFQNEKVFDRIHKLLKKIKLI